MYYFSMILLSIQENVQLYTLFLTPPLHFRPFKIILVIYNQMYAKHSFSFILGKNALEIVEQYKYFFGVVG